jgi:hypothetical protein
MDDTGSDMKPLLLAFMFASLAFSACKKDYDDLPIIEQPEPPEVTTLRSDTRQLYSRAELVVDDVQVQHLLVSFKGGGIGGVERSLDEAEILAAQLYAQIKSGEDFDAMVKKHTNDQYPGIYNLTQRGSGDASNNVFHRRDMVAGFGEVGFRLEVGEVGVTQYHPEKSPYGYHIIKRIK